MGLGHGANARRAEMKLKHASQLFYMFDHLLKYLIQAPWWRKIWTVIIVNSCRCWFVARSR